MPVFPVSAQDSTDTVDFKIIIPFFAFRHQEEFNTAVLPYRGVETGAGGTGRRLLHEIGQEDIRSVVSYRKTDMHAFRILPVPVRQQVFSPRGTGKGPGLTLCFDPVDDNDMANLAKIGRPIQPVLI